MDGLPTTLTTAPFQMADFQHEFTHLGNAPGEYTAHSNAPTASVGTGSPGENWMEIRSLSSSDNGWVDVGLGHGHRNSYDYSDSSAIIFNPAQSLHIRTGSDSSNSNQSDVPRSAHSFSSFEEIQFPMHSPQSETDNHLELVHSHHSHHSHSHSENCNHSHGLQMSDHDFANYISPTQSVSPPMARVEPIVINNRHRTRRRQPRPPSARRRLAAGSLLPQRRDRSLQRPSSRRHPLTPPRRTQLARSASEGDGDLSGPTSDNRLTRSASFVHA